MFQIPNNLLSSKRRPVDMSEYAKCDTTLGHLAKPSLGNPESSLRALELVGGRKRGAEVTKVVCFPKWECLNAA